MHDSAKAYTPLILRLYDFIVLSFSNTFAWRCPTTTVLLPFFTRHLGTASHLDVGVGTGYYAAQSAFLLKKTDVYLADLNPNTLNTAVDRLRAAGHPGSQAHTLVHDAFEPLPDELMHKFDSVSLFYLLHCLPGSMAEKGPRVLSRLAAALKPGGTMYGVTLLGRGVQHNVIARFLMWLYNRKGIFSNRRDDMADLKAALEEVLEDVEVQMVGAVALFVGRAPRVLDEDALEVLQPGRRRKHV